MTRSIAYTTVAIALACAACGDDDDGNDNETNPPPQGSGSTAELTVNRIDIVSDQTGAEVTDPTLVNAWGLAFNPMGAAWVSATETGLSEVYDATGNHLIPAVAMPAPDGDAESHSPTGQIFNADDSAFNGDRFIFVTEQGTISGWDLSDGTEAVLRVDNSEMEAVYKGVASATDAGGQPLLFAVDFRGAKVDVFDAAYEPVTTSGGFVDEDIPSDFAPFNVEALEGVGLIVTFAKQDDEKEDDVKGDGNGFVDLFDVDGNMMARLASRGTLNSPWGVVMTPDSFEAAPDRLLIGNFGDGLIHVYALDTSDLAAVTAVHEGELRDSATGDPIAIDGLWALEFGIDAGGFSADQLYFTAGPDDEEHGVFGRLESAASNEGSAGSGETGGGTAGSGPTY